MAEMHDMARDPKHKRRFEALLYLAARRGDADLVAERLSWGIDPNCRSAKRQRTPLMANVVGSCPGAATVRSLLKGGADPNLTDTTGLTALDYARRKLSRVLARPRRTPRKSPSLDENDQLKLSAEEQAELDKLRAALGDDARDYLRMWWQERLRAACRVFNDPEQIEQIVKILEAVGGTPTLTPIPLRVQVQREYSFCGYPEFFTPDRNPVLVCGRPSCTDCP